MRIRKIINVWLAVILVLLSGCTTRKNINSDYIRAYRVENNQQFTMEELEQIADIMQERLDAYSSDGKVDIKSMGGLEEFYIEITNSEELDSEVYEVIISNAKLEFITGYETENAKTVLTQMHIVSAEVGQFNDDTGMSNPEIKLTFNEEGAKIFAQVTKENVGKAIAIVYDGELLLNPLVSHEISGGEAVIEGFESIKEAERVALIIKTGIIEAELVEIKK